jgi:hypothetical protein
VTDDGIARLTRLKDLRTVILNKTPITDRSIASLKSMKQLRCIFLQGTSVTPHGVAELRHALPDCIVDDFSADGSAYPPHLLE